MSCSLLITNRTLLKYPIFILSRHLSTVHHSRLFFYSNPSQENNLPISNIHINSSYYPKRSITLHVPHKIDEKNSSSKQSSRLPFEFPPGNPNDKPKLEHLRFIENQLTQILPDFFKRMHPYALYTADMIFENYYYDPPKISKGAGGYALALFWIRTKLNFKLMNITVHLLKTTIDEESNCVKIRWRISGISNKSFFGMLKGWKKPKDIAGNIRDYIEYIDGLSTFYVRGDGRIIKHRIDRVMIDEDKELAKSPLNKKKLPAAAPMSS